VTFLIVSLIEENLHIGCWTSQNVADIPILCDKICAVMEHLTDLRVDTWRERSTAQHKRERTVCSRTRAFSATTPADDHSTVGLPNSELTMKRHSSVVDTTSSKIVFSLLPNS